MDEEQTTENKTPKPSGNKLIEAYKNALTEGLNNRGSNKEEQHAFLKSAPATINEQAHSKYMEELLPTEDYTSLGEDHKNILKRFHHSMHNLMHNQELASKTGLKRRSLIQQLSSPQRKAYMLATFLSHTLGNNHEITKDILSKLKDGVKSQRGDKLIVPFGTVPKAEVKQSEKPVQSQVVPEVVEEPVESPVSVESPTNSETSEDTQEQPFQILTELSTEDLEPSEQPQSTAEATIEQSIPSAETVSENANTQTNETKPKKEKKKKDKRKSTNSPTEALHNLIEQLVNTHTKNKNYTSEEENSSAHGFLQGLRDVLQFEEYGGSTNDIIQRLFSAYKRHNPTVNTDDIAEQLKKWYNSFKQRHNNT